MLKFAVLKIKKIKIFASVQTKGAFMIEHDWFFLGLPLVANTTPLTRQHLLASRLHLLRPASLCLYFTLVFVFGARQSRTPLFRCRDWTWQDANFSECFLAEMTAVSRWLPASVCKKEKKKKKEERKTSSERGNVLRPSAGNTRRLVNTFHVTTTAAAAAQWRCAVTRAPACRRFGLINGSEFERSGRTF